MARDPAFLFYSNDFEVRTKFFNHEQVGKYIRLLITQHQFGHLSKEQVISTVGSWDDAIMAKFTVGTDGLFFNERLDFEINKRKAFTDSRKANASHKHSTSFASAKHMHKHMENENENGIKRGGMGESRPVMGEVLGYFEELGAAPRDGAAFHDHFQSNGWKVGGRAPMKDWKAAARNWVRRNHKGSGIEKLTKAQQATAQSIQEFMKNGQNGADNGRRINLKSIPVQPI